MIIETGKHYILVNKKAGTVIDLDIRNNKTVHCWTRHGGTNQLWDFTCVPDGWHIRNAQQGTYLTFEGNARDGQRVICTHEPYVWHIWPDKKDSNAHRICVPNTQQNLDLSDHGNGVDGTTVQLWTSWEVDHQAWYAEQVAYI
jgi:hypothetical protein